MRKLGLRTGITSLAVLGGADAKRRRALASFHAALAGRASTPVDIMWMGDSITEGFDQSATVQVGQRWVDIAAEAVRTAYPTPGADGPCGYFAAVRGNGNFSSTWPCVIPGGQATSTNWGLGRRSVSFTASGGYVDFTVPDDTTSIDLVTSRGPTTSGIQYSINGSPTGSFDTTGVLAHIKTNITGVSPGDVVRVERTSGDTLLVGVFAHTGTEAKGVRGWEGGHYAYSTNSWGTSTNNWWGAVQLLQPRLVVIALGTNDANTAAGNRTAAQFKSSLAGIISIIKGKCVVAPSFVITTCWPAATVVEPWENYVTAAREIAAADPDVVHLDFRAVIDNHGDTNSTVGGLLPDKVHPSPAGHALMGDLMGRFLL